MPVLADVEREKRGEERYLIRDELELALRDVELPDRKIEAELVQPRVVLLSLKVDDLPWETGSRSGSGQSALLRPASARSSSGPETSSLYQPRPMGRGETRRALHRLVTIGSLCLLGELPATPLAPSLLAPHPMSCATELALRLLRRRGLCGRTNKRTTCRSFETAGVKHGHPLYRRRQVAPRIEVVLPFRHTLRRTELK